MNLKFLFIALMFPFFGSTQIDFIWSSDCELDSAFTTEWLYEEGIFVNRWGQLSCDGFCPRESDYMKDEQGRIFDDSLSAFYSIVDTTHRHFTLERSDEPYDYAAAHYIMVERKNGKLLLKSELNMGLNTRICIEFDPTVTVQNDVNFEAYLIYYSLSDQAPRKFKLQSGVVEFCEQAYKEGFLQLKFNLDFETDEWSEEKSQNWEGKIFVEL